MQIAKSAALLGTAAGIVMLWGGAAAAGGGPSGGDGGGGAQINKCKSISINLDGGQSQSSASCLNFDESFGKHKGGPQVNDCEAVSVSNVGNLVFLPMAGNSAESDVHCANIRH